MKLREMKQARNCGDRKKAGQSFLHPPSQSQVEIVHRECSQQPQLGEWQQPFLFCYPGGFTLSTVSGLCVFCTMSICENTCLKAVPVIDIIR